MLLLVGNGTVQLGTVQQAASNVTAVRPSGALAKAPNDWHSSQNHPASLYILLLGYDHIEAEEHHPGQDLLAHQLQAQLLLNLYEGSSLYPVVKDLALDWPLQTLTKVLAHESPEAQKEKRDKLKGG